MQTCPECHRHVRADESGCPFCGTALRSAGAPQPFAPLALAVGLGLFGCSEGDEGETAATLSDSSSETSTSTSTGGTETQDTEDTEDWAGSDYGGAPPPCDSYESQELIVGVTAVDSTQTGNQVFSTCGEAQGSGNDALLRFVAPAEGTYSIALSQAETEMWLVQASEYGCYAYGGSECSLPQGALSIELGAEEVLHLWLDGSGAGGMANVEITGP